MKKISSSLGGLSIKLLTGILIVAVLAGCGRKVAFATSTVVPGAEGKVKVKKDNNGNHAIDVEIKHLAEPNRLPFPQNTYVVWMESSEGIKNLGQLRTSSGLLSSTRKGELETVSPYRPTRIFITAEGDAGVQYPGNQVVMTTSAF